MNETPDSLLQAIRDGNRFLLTSHMNPDGDAIGSEIGLVRVLRAMGKGSVIWNRDECPTVYRPLPGTEAIHHGTEPPASFPESFDAAIVLECPSLDRTGLEEALGQLEILNIDHHLGNEHYGSQNWVDTAAPALGAMIFRLAQGLKVPVDERTATAVYLALASDTGTFRFANTTAEAFDAAAEMVRAGAQPHRVSQWLHESRPEGAVRLLGEMLQSLEVHAGGKVATALLTREMFERAGAQPADSESLIDHPRSIAGVQAAALLRQIGDGEYKVSMRSSGGVDVQRVALESGGGGHRNAAGFKASGPVDEIRESLVATLAALVEQLPDA